MTFLTTLLSLIVSPAQGQVIEFAALRCAESTLVTDISAMDQATGLSYERVFAAPTDCTTRSADRVAEFALRVKADCMLSGLSESDCDSVARQVAKTSIDLSNAPFPRFMTLDELVLDANGEGTALIHILDNRDESWTRTVDITSGVGFDSGARAELDWERDGPCRYAQESRIFGEPNGQDMVGVEVLVEQANHRDCIDRDDALTTRITARRSVAADAAQVEVP